MADYGQTNESGQMRTVLVEIQRLLAKGFSKKELRQLCFLLGLDYDDVEGKGKTGKSRELVLLMWRSGRLQELLEAAAEERPESPWPELPAGDQAQAHAPGWTDQPRQLPPRTARFTGRQAELANLVAELAPGRVITLAGPGGIGKTALATEAVWQLEENHQLIQRFPDGVLFHTFYNQPEAGVALEHFCRSYGVNPRPTPREAARMVLAGRQALLILDGAEDADDLPAVLDVRGRCGVLLTTRKAAQAVDDWTDLAAPPENEALALLRKWAGDLAADEAAALAICRLLGRLPLAIRLAGRFMARQQEEAAAYLAWLRRTPLTALDRGRRRQDSVPHLMARSLAQVDRAAQEALAVAGQLAFAPFELDVLDAGLGLDETAVRPAVAQLLDYALLVKVDGRYQSHHALVYAYARRRVELPDGAQERLVTYYGRRLDEANAAGAAGFETIAGEQAHMLSLLERLMEGAAWDLVLRLAHPLRDYLDLQGLWTERLAVCQSALRAAQGQENPREESVWLDSLGQAYAEFGRADEAIEAYEQALNISRQLADRALQCRQLSNLGEVYRYLGQVEKAIDFYQQSLDIAIEIDDRHGHAYSLGNLGKAHAALGQLDKAVNCHEQALNIGREIEDQRIQGNNLGNLGLTYFALGQLDKAINYFRLSLAIQREIGDRSGMGNSLGNLGLVYGELGQIEKAIDYHQQALGIGRSIGDLRMQTNELGNLGLAYYVMGQLDEAIDYHQQALTISRQIRDRRGQAADLGNLGLAYQARGQSQVAIEHYQQALAIQREIGDRRGEGNQLGNLGASHAALGQLRKAVEYHLQAMTIGREVGDRRLQGRSLGNLGLAYHELGQLEKAVDFHEQALAIGREIGDRNLEADQLGNLALAYHGQGRIARAIELMSQALTIFEEIQSPSAEMARLMLEELEREEE